MADHVRSKPEASSAMGPIAQALLQDYLGPDNSVIDMDRLFTALVQALHDAYTQGWQDHSKVERNRE